MPTFEGGPTEVEVDDSNRLVLVVCWVTGHVVLLLLLATATGLAAAAVWVASAVAVQAGVWKRKELVAIAGRARQSEAAQRAVEHTKAKLAEFASPNRQTTVRTSEGASGWDVEIDDPSDDDLVEVRPARGKVVSPRSRQSEPSWSDPRRPAGGKRDGKPLKSNAQKDGIAFYRVGDRLDLGRGVLESPLVYATQRPQHGQFDASLIDTSLRVAASGTRPRYELPYWPSYYDCTAAQRSRYLDWLLGGRSDPQVELGYVFIYFYGLERRVLVDRADYEPVARELLRLLPVYSHSNSFRRYATNLLWLALTLASESSQVSEAWLCEAVEATERWNDDLVAMCLAVLHNTGRPLPSHIALIVCQNDPRSTSSVVLRRHRQEFHKLFQSKYKTLSGEGITLRASKRKKILNVHPASGTLLRDGRQLTGDQSFDVPNVLGLPSQFKELVALWEASVDELKAYSRASRKADGQITAEVYEALPPELQEGDHPEFDAWMEVWENNVDDEGWPVVPASALATLKAIDPRGTLTKTQCAKLLKTADAVGLGVEPDARITGKNYKWDERLTLFFVEDNTPCDVANYLAASVLLRLGAAVAEADGSVDEEELRFITDHLEGQFDLSDADAKRLERLQYLLLHARTGDSSVTKTLASRLSHKQRLLVGEFLVGVAAVDEVITQEEVRVLRKAYRSLDLQESDLNDLLARHASATVTTGSADTPQATDGLRLDMSVVSRIMTETRQVAAVLRDAMTEEAGTENEVTPGVSPPENHPADSEANPPPAASTPADQVDKRQQAGTGLEPRYQPFLAGLLVQKVWSSTELRGLADRTGVMASGAVEAVNEWALDTHGDWLIEEGDHYIVRTELLDED